MQRRRLGLEPEHHTPGRRLSTTPDTTPTTTPDTASASSAAPETTAYASPTITSDPFTLGVASGDPLADSVILWTRLLPVDPLPDTDIEVTWEIARDAEFADVVGSGTALAVAALGPFRPRRRDRSRTRQRVPLPVLPR